MKGKERKRKEERRVPWLDQMPHCMVEDDEKQMIRDKKKIVYFVTNSTERWFPFLEFCRAGRL